MRTQSDQDRCEFKRLIIEYCVHQDVPMVSLGLGPKLQKLASNFDELFEIRKFFLQPHPRLVITTALSQSLNITHY